MRKLLPLLAALMLALVAAGCGGEDDDDQAAAPTTTAETAASDACATENLELVNAGKLTIGTDNPAYPPWFGGPEKAPWKISDPRSAQGFESAVAYAVANELGFQRGDVEWVVVPFNNSFKPGPEGAPHCRFARPS